MSDKTQTAVEQLHEQSAELLSKYSKGEITISDFMIQHHNLIYLALDNEKQMIIDAWADGITNWDSEKTSEHYYTETYKQLKP